MSKLTEEKGVDWAGDPFDDPLWQEATRRADGYTHPRAGYIGFPEAWLEQCCRLSKPSSS